MSQHMCQDGVTDAIESAVKDLNDQLPDLIEKLTQDIEEQLQRNTEDAINNILEKIDEHLENGLQEKAEERAEELAKEMAVVYDFFQENPKLDGAGYSSDTFLARMDTNQDKLEDAVSPFPCPVCCKSLEIHEHNDQIICVSCRRVYKLTETEGR